MLATGDVFNASQTAWASLSVSKTLYSVTGLVSVPHDDEVGGVALGALLRLIPLRGRCHRLTRRQLPKLEIQDFLNTSHLTEHQEGQPVPVPFESGHQLSQDGLPVGVLARAIRDGGWLHAGNGDIRDLEDFDGFREFAPPALAL